MMLWRCGLFLSTLITVFYLVKSQDLVLKCPTGWIEVLSRCYLPVNKLTTTWSFANDYCKRYGGKLAEPKGYDLSRQLGQLLGNQTSSYWIGFTQTGIPDTNPEQGFWSDGVATTVDVGWWDDFQPDRRGGECAVLQQSSSQWKWTLINCQELRPFLCQTSACPADTFRCTNGECIGTGFVCNGVTECEDGLDERGCDTECKVNIMGSEGEITHPGNTSLYSPSTTCLWTIEGDVGTNIQIQLTEIDIEDKVDYLEVWVGGMTISSSKLRARLTGRKITNIQPVVSSNNLAILRFVTDSSVQYSGFKLQWRSDFRCSMTPLHNFKTDDQTSTIASGRSSMAGCQTDCSNHNSCVAFLFSSLRCILLAEFPVLVPETGSTIHFKTCPNINGYPTIPSLPFMESPLEAVMQTRQLYSPLYPVYFLDNLVTSWTIESSGSNVVTLEIKDLDLANSGELVIFDGDNPASPVLQRLTKSSNVQLVTSTGNFMYIHYNSGIADTSSSTVSRGFLFHYRQGCDNFMNVNQGEVISPGYDRGQYPNILDCTWTIRSLSGTSLTLTFDPIFRLENNKDFVRVYRSTGVVDPAHTGSGFTGTTAPERIVSANGQLYIQISTSALGQDKGFKATFSAGCRGLNDQTIKIQPHHSSYDHAEVIEITCVSNQVFANSIYRGMSRVSLTCTNGGTWDKEIPTCSRVLCSALPSINNGYLLSSSGPYAGARATYACNYGYNMSNPASISCGTSGQWESPPSCYAISCPSRSGINNGNVKAIYGDGYRQGSVLEYSCISGYEIVGSNIATCQNTAWSNQLPSCSRVRCGYVKIENGVISQSGPYYEGDRLNVVCNPGYRVTGSTSFTCGQTPPTCSNINECTSGGANCVSATCTDTIGSYTCTCKPGYQPSSPGSNVCNDINECSTNNGGCDQVCENKQGSYNCSCYSNYVLLTSSSQNGVNIPSGVTSRDYGHVCLAIQCPSPQLFISNGRAKTARSRFSVGESVTYACDVGYVPQGSTTISCTGSGTWNGQPPNCVAVTCSPPSVSSNGPSVSPSSSIRYQEYFTLTCPLPNNQIQTQQRACIYNPSTRDYNVLSGSLQCPEINCGIPPRISGTLSYSYSCTTSGCSFEFRCRTPWFQLQGSSGSNNDLTVRCGNDGHWDFGDLRCPGPTCSDPGTPPGGEQISTSYEEYSIVSYRCRRTGFQPSDDRPLQCYWDNSLNSLRWNGSRPDCRDRISPTFDNCPGSDVIVSKLSPSGLQELRASDNSNMVARYTVTPPTFTIDHIITSDRQITYTATDYEGNNAQCYISIRVRDDRAPIIECQNSLSVYLSNVNDNRQYDINSLVLSSRDDSGQVRVTGTVDTINIDRYSIGRTFTNTLTATDPTGNTAQCVVQISVTGPTCEPWTLQLRNGRTTCNQNSNGGYDCTATCERGYAMYENIAQSSVQISCNRGGDWSRSLPVCVALHSSSYELSFVLSYQSTQTVPSGCSSTYRDQLENKMPTLVSSLSNLCSGLNPSISVRKSNLVSVQNYFSGVYGTIHLSLEPRDYNNDVYQACASRIKNAIITATSDVSSIERLDRSNNCPESYRYNYQSTSKDGFGCSFNEQLGQINQGSTICVECPTGYSSEDGRLCRKCPVGSYRGSNSRTCQRCPTNARNDTEGATDIHDCYLICPVGMTSASGRSPCSPCPVNTYSTSDRTCSSCPSGTQTPGVGASSSNDCKAQCQPGFYSKTGFEPCSPCPKGFYQPDSRSTTCLECALSQTTASTGSRNQVDCQTAASVECYPGRCKNGASCYIEYHQYYCRCPSGFTGRDCSTRINPCDSSPCYNDGVCAQDNSGGYVCYCRSGRFSGLRCENDVNDCQFNSCLNNGSCHDKIGAYFCLCPSFSGFSGSSCQTLRQVCNEDRCSNGQCVASGNIRRKCICDAGYTGDKCDQDINECSSSPCRNNGTCVNQRASYSCRCASGFSGTNCEIMSDPCSQFTCNSGTCVHDYNTGVTECVCSSDYERVNNECKRIDPCSPNPCQNGATCRSGGSGYICDCRAGFGGYNCQQNINDCASVSCKNSGICVDGVNTYSCQCDPSIPDTGGQLCDDQRNNCSPNPCNTSNTRNCVDLLGDYRCDCYSGYTGKNCNNLVNYCASFPCQHGGTCSNRYGGFSCQCPSSYTGSRCEQGKDNCNGQPCYNGGTCITTDVGYVCQCLSGYKGRNCQVNYDPCAVANPCVGVGSRCSHDGSRFSCQCLAGYSGEYCEYKTNACTSSTCLNGGTCVEINGRPVCQCSPGFNDTICSNNINDCTASSCITNAVCVDGINSFTCQCKAGKIGLLCDKDIRYDFDVLLSRNDGFMTSDYFIQPQALAATDRLSVAFWVRYTQEPISSGIIATLYGTNSPGNVDQSQELLRFNKDNLIASFASPQMMTYNQGKVADGKWHHVMITWDSSIPLLNLFIDNNNVNSVNYGLNSRLPTYVWLALGGTFNKTNNFIDQSDSMTGRISRLFVTSSAVQPVSLNASLTLVPNGVNHGFTSDILDGVNGLVDFNSELNADGCYVTDTCSTFSSASRAAPSVSMCPSDLMVVSGRTDSPAWPKPLFTNTNVVRTNHLSAAEPLDWGAYSIAYAGLDNQSNADVCSFYLYNRRAECSIPKKPLLGSIICDTATDGFRCRAECSQSNHRLAEPVPVYYSCGTYNSNGNNELAYRFPSCTSCDEPKQDIDITVTFTLQRSCNAIGQPVLEADIRTSVMTLNSRFDQALCSRSDCSDVSVKAGCIFNTLRTDVEVKMLLVGSTLTVSGQQLSTVDALSSAIIDDSGLQVNSGILLRSSYDIQATSKCTLGRQLVNDCCAECGFGTYYDLSRLECTRCPRGTYLDATGANYTGSGASPCKGCPGGMTTALTGAQSEDECKDSCAPGKFYNLTIGRCEECPIGFYQELAGTFFCQPCPVTMTTMSTQSTSYLQCILITIVPTTTISSVNDTNSPSVGASTSSIWSGEVIALFVVVFIVFILLILVILCFCCRGCLQSICPCFVTKVGPEEKTDWHYVNRFGETNIKFVSYKLSEFRQKKKDREALMRAMSEEEIPKNISIQVPVFEEKLNGTTQSGHSVKKKSLHISNVAPHSTVHKSPKLKNMVKHVNNIPTFTVASGQHPKALPPLPERLRGTPTSTPEKVRRPPSAFNRPRVQPVQQDYEEFIISKPPIHHSSKISIDSDDDYR